MTREAADRAHTSGAGTSDVGRPLPRSRRRQPTVYWTAERDGVRHAFRPRQGQTLCNIRVDERFSVPTQPKCAACQRLLDEEVAIAR